jgi:hypothetical protein
VLPTGTSSNEIAQAVGVDVKAVIVEVTLITAVVVPVGVVVLTEVGGVPVTVCVFVEMLVGVLVDVIVAVGAVALGEGVTHVWYCKANR